MGWLWAYYGMQTHGQQVALGPIMGSLWGPYGVAMGLLWDADSRPAGGSRSHYGVPMGSLWGGYGPIMGCRLTASRWLSVSPQKLFQKPTSRRCVSRSNSAPRSSGSKARRPPANSGPPQTASRQPRLRALWDGLGCEGTHRDTWGHIETHRDT
uniref:Uncharacterized protein n=1 Tax=Gallus gallus TaxID=9031 RepID=A0A8V0X5R3_CHICK